MFDHRHVEALPMRRLKCDLWKVGIVIAGVLFLLVLMAWIPISAAGAEVRASGLVTPVTVQATPTEDATMTALNKENLQLDINKDRSDLFWAWTASGTITTAVCWPACARCRDAL
jgi:hypothetical protein